MNILVTGGSRGIGKAIVARLLEDGHKVVYTFNSSTPEESRENCFAVKADVTSAEDCKRLVAEAETLLGGKIYGLVNNAGVNRDNLLLRMSEDDFTAVLDTDLKGPFLLAKEVLPSMMKQRTGRIVNMASVIGLYGNAGQANYAAAKAGLIALTKTMAKEFASRNILCNAIAPGMVRTDMTDQMPEKAREMALSRIALKRMAEPSEIASVVSFLLSEDSSYMTGQCLEVGGGLLI